MKAAARPTWPSPLRVAKKPTWSFNIVALRIRRTESFPLSSDGLPSVRTISSSRWDAGRSSRLLRGWTPPVVSEPSPGVPRAWLRIPLSIGLRVPVNSPSLQEVIADQWGVTIALIQAYRREVVGCKLAQIFKFTHVQRIVTPDCETDAIENIVRLKIAEDGNLLSRRYVATQATRHIG